MYTRSEIANSITYHIWAKHFKTYEYQSLPAIVWISVVSNICYRVLSSSCPHWAFSIKESRLQGNQTLRTVTAILRPKTRASRVCNSIPSLPQHTYTLFHNFRNLLFKRTQVHHHIIKLEGCFQFKKSMCTPSLKKSGTSAQKSTSYVDSQYNILQTTYNTR